MITMDAFRVIANRKRREMLRMLARKETHIAALARQLGISSPVALRHVRLLEDAGFIQRERTGNADRLRITDAAMEVLLRFEELLDKPSEIIAHRGEPLSSVLKRVPGIQMRRWRDTGEFFVVSVDGEPGSYIFLINGKLPQTSVDRVTLTEDSVLEFQKLVPLLGRRLDIKVE